MSSLTENVDSIPFFIVRDCEIYQRRHVSACPLVRDWRLSGAILGTADLQLGQLLFHLGQQLRRVHTRAYADLARLQTGFAQIRARRAGGGALVKSSREGTGKKITN